jgi:hypothetical protein
MLQCCRLLIHEQGKGAIGPTIHAFHCQFRNAAGRLPRLVNHPTSAQVAELPGLTPWTFIDDVSVISTFRLGLNPTLTLPPSFSKDVKEGQCTTRLYCPLDDGRKSINHRFTYFSGQVSGIAISRDRMMSLMYPIPVNVPMRGKTSGSD